eukprot:6885564-Alexandrium_andersonii.AAC.1
MSALPRLKQVHLRARVNTRPCAHPCASARAERWMPVHLCHTACPPSPRARMAGGLSTPAHQCGLL